MKKRLLLLGLLSCIAYWVLAQSDEIARQHNDNQLYQSFIKVLNNYSVTQDIGPISTYINDPDFNPNSTYTIESLNPAETITFTPLGSAIGDAYSPEIVHLLLNRDALLNIRTTSESLQPWMNFAWRLPFDMKKMILDNTPNDLIQLIHPRQNESVQDFALRMNQEVMPKLDQIIKILKDRAQRLLAYDILTGMAEYEQQFVNTGRKTSYSTNFSVTGG